MALVAGTLFVVLLGIKKLCKEEFSPCEGQELWNGKFRGGLETREREIRDLWIDYGGAMNC